MLAAKNVENIMSSSYFIPWKSVTSIIVSANKFRKVNFSPIREILSNPNHKNLSKKNCQDRKCYFLVFLVFFVVDDHLEKIYFVIF